MTDTSWMRLLEREASLASLAGYAAEARSGAGRLVLVSGKAGVGKSALVRSLPAGPRAATRKHPSGLTRRERQVLALLCARRTALDRIAQADPVIGGELRAAVETGLRCCYRPAPR